MPAEGKPGSHSLGTPLPSLALAAASQSEDPSSLCWARRGDTQRQHKLLPSTQEVEEQDRAQRGASSAGPHKHRDRQRLREGESTGTSCSVGLAALLTSRACPQHRAQNKLGANQGVDQGPGSRRAAAIALRLSKRCQVQPGAAGAALGPGVPRLQVAGRGFRAALLSTHSPQRGSCGTEHEPPAALPCPRSKGTGPPPGIPTCGCIPPEREQAEIRPLHGHPCTPQ